MSAPHVPERGVGEPSEPTPGGKVRATVNGEPCVLVAGSTVADMVAQVCAVDRGVAVALDREVVPRSAWAKVLVPDGAQVEVVTAAAGG